MSSERDGSDWQAVESALERYFTARESGEAIDVKAACDGDVELAAKVLEVLGDAPDLVVDAVEEKPREQPVSFGDFDIVDAVNRQMERAKERETANLKRGLGLIATTGTTAPFIGLFGTVVGIINSFQGLSGDGGGGLGAVAGGISEALFATAVGLLVAIPAVAAYNYFTSRVLKLQIDMNDVASELVDYVLKEGRY